MFSFFAITPSGRGLIEMLNLYYTLHELDLGNGMATGDGDEECYVVERCKASSCGFH